MEFFENEIVLFPTSYAEILQRVLYVSPVKYGATRNYVNGSVSYLSPYISRGVISTKFVLESLLNKGHSPYKIEKFIQELAWRDYWQQVWIEKGDSIDADLRSTQEAVTNTGFSKNLIKGATGIKAIDEAIQHFYKTGYLHNHLRMYISSMACNLAKSHWKGPAQWMYYHLLDADWASNALSWQWVAGTNSNKKYYANQENINKYCFTDQKNTFLDVSYAAFPTLEIPVKLLETVLLDLKTILPPKKTILIDEGLPTCIYNFYNLDPLWKKESSVNRILVLEPSLFQKYPVSEESIDFVLELSMNIPNIQVYAGEFNQLLQEYSLNDVYYKEHPLNTHYKGIEEPRDWMFSVKGYHASFFSFWKKCKKELNY
jgi:deoxyribodipyrimidine photo-lyase